ncbi:MAG: RNA methyltransferase [Deltaproteobacteria bacterium]|jgi:tRNA/rRNA methyltransferase|nr:RNA methyltransferase [Deltaproteobacteria bacterium]
MPDRINLKNISIVLHRPRAPENIGAAARAMRNMGIDQLVVVKPRNCDLTRVCKMATHAALDVVENMMVFDTLEEALGGYGFVAGTTARLGGERKVITSPPILAEKLFAVSEQNRIAILFGPEDRGLTNEDIRRCHTLVNIPTAEFSSLNLAQAVMIVCYELFRYTTKKPHEFVPRLANRHELDAMYAQLKKILIQISFINPDNPDYFLNNFRHFFSRLPLRAKEVQIIRGICRQIKWYGEKRYQDGLQKKTD